MPDLDNYRALLRRVDGLLRGAACEAEALGVPVGAFAPAPHLSDACVWGGTFHAIAHRLVCIHAESLSLPPAPSVLDGSDATDLMDLLRHDHDLSGTRMRFPTAATLVDVYSRAVNTCAVPICAHRLWAAGFAARQVGQDHDRWPYVCST